MSGSINFFDTLHQHISVASQLDTISINVENAGEVIIECLNNRGNIFFCGNGGSAADCQHLAAELTGRFVNEREPKSGIALTTDTSALTAISNDYGFEFVFARQLQALGKYGDCLIAISSSGNSKNVIEAVRVAQDLDIHTIALVGEDGGKLAGICDFAIKVPSKNTARIQEMHILIGHHWCSMVDEINATNS